MKEYLRDLTDLSKEDILKILDLADEMKKNPDKYTNALLGKTLLMIFEKPSLRTRVSFEVGMTQLGGHAIYYDIATSPMGKKESISDTVKTASRYVNIIMARLFKHEHLTEMAEHATIPVINALTDFSHPCQVLADLQTIREKKGTLKGLKLAYLGDGHNNVTHSLLYGCALVGMDISIGSPEGHAPMESVVNKAEELASSDIVVTNDPIEAIKDADIVYTDSWMSYHIAADKKEERIKVFTPYQVNKDLMKHAKKDAIFMNCLPAMRGMEQTKEVIDGPQSVVFNEAENRLHTQKALILTLLS
ncbi:ornithine carbamoyltransferase [Candidatus Woesearchaeota archaeon]|nr:ornithine carbamoyltransferase [Candidatus Woesearchaeota archaeon]